MKTPITIPIKLFHENSNHNRIPNKKSRKAWTYQVPKIRKEREEERKINTNRL